MINYLFYSNDYCHLCLENKTDTYICEECKNKIEYIDGEREIEGGICMYPIFYSNFIKDAIKKFKYEKNTFLVKPFAEMLYNYYCEKKLEVDYVSYIPMYSKDEYNRGYNQSKLLAEYFCKLTGLELVELLIKNKSTKHQNKLTKKDRMRNLENSFECIISNNINGKNILFIDDIVTTGSTFNAISNEIKKHYDANIMFLALASSKID